MKKIILLAAICAICTQANSQWNITGNAGTNASTNFIGTTDNIAFKIRTNNGTRMTISSAGKVGIGITSPAGKLHVKGNTDVSQLIIDGGATQSNTNPLIRLRNNAGSDLMWIHSDDSTNIFIGKNAGTINSVAGNGRYNTVMGTSAFRSNTTGTYNTTSGYQSLYSNTTGDQNTAIGASALYFNTIGYLNTGIGSAALALNSEGHENTAVGSNALGSNTLGDYNAAIGSDALYQNITGNDNIAMGYVALFHNTSASDNIAIGSYSLFGNTVANQNIAIGSNALTSSTTASNNIAIGTNALFTQSFDNGGIAWASGNVALGFETLYLNQSSTVNNGKENTAIGNKALRSNDDGTYNTATGSGALFSNDYGGLNTAVGYNALYASVSGDYNTSIGAYANTSTGNLSYATAIGGLATVNASNKVRIGNTSATVIEGQVAYSWPSDGRFKENVKEDVKGLDFIMKLKPVSYNFNRLKFARHIKEHLTTEREKALTEQSENRTVGFIAQDVEKIIDQTGFNSFDAVHAPTNETDNYSMAYAEFVVPLVKAVQELSNENENLKSDIEIIKSVLYSEQKQKFNEVRNENKAILEQNTPNPFNIQTEIKFQLPSIFNSAQLVIVDAEGKKVRSVDLKTTSSVLIEAGEFPGGVYTYSLIIDGVNVDSKQMVLTK